jgi:hypothetical protein
MPAVTIGRAEQVNVAERQTNAVVKDERHTDYPVKTAGAPP